MILAFDTSCYTTSVALMSTEGKLIADKRRVLTVKQGRRGLAQSEALFQHINNLPAFMEELGDEVNFRKVMAIGYSAKPRRRDDSYMPVFLAGENCARSLAAALDVPLYPQTHQEGHMAAAFYSAGDFVLDENDEFIFGHFSGGTSELLLVKKYDVEYEISIVASSNDLHAGQLIDRVGVALGFSFPAGPLVEKTAAGFSGTLNPVKTWVKGGEFSFSGQETALQRRIAAGEESASLCRAAEHAIGETIGKALDYSICETDCHKVLLAGGVMANGYIRSYLKSMFKDEIYFAAPQYSSDNGVGVAKLTLDKYLKGAK